MYAYCINNPIVYTDHKGFLPYKNDIIGNCAMLFDREYNYQGVDLTEKINQFMSDNAQKLQEYQDENGYVKAVTYFYENVKDGGDLDIKLQDEWQFEEGKTYYYEGVELRFDDPGNINFGYVGAVLFPEEILCLGAGINQISKHGFKYGDLSTYYDDPRDQEMIRWGYIIYWEAQR